MRLGDFTESIGEADKYIKSSLKEHMWERIWRGLRWCDNKEDMKLDPVHSMLFGEAIELPLN